MKKTKYFCLLSISGILLSGCGESLMDNEMNTATPIVESYLQEGTNSLTVKLYSMEVYLGEDYILSKPLTDLTVHVNGKALTETDRGAYSLDLGSDIIRGLQEYRLQFDYQGKAIQSSTIVPQPIERLAIEPSSITRTSSSYYWNTNDTTEIVLSWDDPEHSYYQIYVESPDTSSANPSFGGVFGRRMMQPFQGDTYTMRMMEFPYTGNYSISVYRVNKDYAELYERVSASDLANPVSFVENALGIFTSMSMASVRFTVYDE
jgi:hypothetical protein